VGGMSEVVHCKRDPYDVYIGRPSKWGNPFSHRGGTLARFVVGNVDEAIAAYEDWLLNSEEAEGLRRDLHELRGKVLGCWCKPGPCHGDVLARLANDS